MPIAADPISESRPTIGAVTARFLERDVELAALLGAVERAAAGDGSVALVHGEAGIGKSTLVGALSGALPSDARLLLGHCDDLATPRLLGPFRDLVPTVGAELARTLKQGDDRDQLFDALREELNWTGHATVLVVEDAHWADDATLDALRFLVRRVGTLPALLVLTYRDDLVREHPLHQLVGLCHSVENSLDLPLKPLSPGAVGTLTGRADAGRVHTITGGNPFFVQELTLAGSENPVPVSVVQSVRSRLDRLPAQTRDSVEQLSVLTSGADRELVDALEPDGMAVLVPAEEHGLLEVNPHRVAFRHELTRRAVLDALPTTRRTMLNGRALAALEARGDADLAQLVHHASQAGDAAAVARWGPEAAATAASGGAHREAAAHYHSVLAHAVLFDDAQLADLLDASAVECYTVADQSGRKALDDQLEAVRLRRTLDDKLALGASLRWLSRIAWWRGDRALAEESGAEAVAVLREFPESRELALAHSNLSQLDMLASRMPEAVEQAELAIDLARKLGDVAIEAHALNNLGTAEWTHGLERGRHHLAESLRLCLEHGLHEHAGRAYCNMVWALLSSGLLDEAERVADEGITYSEWWQQEVYWAYIHVEKSMIMLRKGRWQDVPALAAHGLGATDPIRCTALGVIATLRVRQGAAREEIDPLVEEVWQLAHRLDELQRTGPAAALVCESAWLRGDLETVREVGGTWHAEARRLENAEYADELAFWLHQAGVTVELGEGDSPYLSMCRGRWEEAAIDWARRGCRYESGLALACSDDEALMVRSLGVLDELGAEPLATRVRRELRDRGVSGVPRGPRRETQQNLASLTPRQLDVLALLAEDLSNAQIAERLVLSVRTVDHHVGAILQKLEADSRAAAVTAARGRGWAPSRATT